MTKAYIEYKNVYKNFDDTEVLKDINLSIAEGEFFVLLGGSGCGKTTLVRLLAGLEQVTEGQIFLDEHDVTNKFPQELPVNMVFQNYAVFPTMNVYDNIAYGLKKAKKDKDFIDVEVRKVIKLVDLEGLENRMPDELSGGQSQRVALARAIVLKPKVLILDEPLSALDAKLRTDLQIELVNLQKEVGITFVMVTHDQNEALAMADQMAVMHEGGIIQSGTPEEIYERPNSQYVANFIGRANIFDITVVDEKKTKLTISINGISKVEVDKKYMPNLKKGDQSHMMLRPEKLLLSKNPRNKGISLAGKIAEVRYQGSETLALGTSNTGRKIMGVLDNPKKRPLSEYKAGSRIYASWDFADTYLLDK